MWACMRLTEIKSRLVMLHHAPYSGINVHLVPWHKLEWSGGFLVILLKRPLLFIRYKRQK